MSCLALAVALCGSSAFAQTGAGSIQGTVTDPTGAVIPHASILVVNQKTGVKSTSVTNGVGFYQVPGLFTGTYLLTVKADGMQTEIRSIELLVGQDAVLNFKMQAGAVSQKIVVKGNLVQLITKNNGAIASTLENSRIQQLPMNGRDLVNLVQETTPGLENCSQSASCPNGLMGPAMEYSADGVTLNVREFGGMHQSHQQTPDPDAVEQVRVITDAAGAEYSTPATAIITTKSGTNTLHGNLFETARNNAFGIARSRNNPSNFTAPHYVRNEFGIALGGPITIPHVYNGRNKSFWFFSYERYSLRSDSYENVRVPTMAMRQGDFSGLVNSSGILQQLYDPMTTASSSNCDGTGAANQWCRQPFPTINGKPNQIPADRESPTAKILMDITPVPSNSNNPMVAPNLAYAAPQNQTQPSVSFRLDHVFSEKTRAYVRYTENLSDVIFLRNDPVDEPATVAADGLPYAASGIADDVSRLYAYALGVSHVFSPTFFSETTASQNWYGEQNYAGGTPFYDFEKKLGLPNNFNEPGFPYISGIFSPFDGTQFQYGVSQMIGAVQEHLTKVIGKHQLMFGAGYRYERFGSRPDEVKDEISFDGLDTALEDPTTGSNYSPLPNTGDPNADMFLGGASSYSVNLQAPYQHLHDTSANAYFQDNYRIRKNLTLNLGIRYESHPALVNGDDEMMSFDLKNDAIVLAAPPSQLIAKGLTTQAVITNDELDGVKFETPSQAGLPSTLLKSYDFTWGPRFGIAWLPLKDKWGTVLRGGIGRYIYPEPLRDALVSVDRNNPFLIGYGQSYTSAAQSPDGKPNYLLRSRQPVTMGVNSSGVVDSTTTTAILPGIRIYTLDPNTPPTYVTEGDVTLEQPLKWNSALRISYVFTHGSNLGQQWFYNNHPSTYAWDMQAGIAPPQGHTIGSKDYSTTATGPYDQTTYSGSNFIQVKKGWSNYNALQVNYQRLYRAGIAWQFSYVWSKSMRVGGNSTRDNEYDPYSNYIASGLGQMTQAYGAVQAPLTPPPPPPGVPVWGFYHSLDRFENYMVDTNNPAQHIQFNGIIDLPFGQGKKFFGHAGRALNEVVGGWQIAGSGSVTSQDFHLSDSNWGPVHPLKIYKRSAPIKDCRSGVCQKEYLWFNGYISPTSIAGNPCATGSDLVYGLPSNYVPYQSPVDTGCTATGRDKYFGKNEVEVTLQNGKTESVGYQPYPTSNNHTGVGTDGGNNIYAKMVLPGPMNYNVDLSLFKVFPITRSVRLRVNVDAFNAFNIQGDTNPGSDGTLKFESGGIGASSYNSPRQIQLTARLTF